MPTGDESAFLAAIAAAPDDDTPRLAFADWLDERGNADDSARAEFIRVQCRAETLRPRSTERGGLEKRAKAVLKVHGPDWLRPIADDIFGATCAFRRGFVHHVTMSARRFSRVAGDLFRLAPTVRAATFPDASNEVGDLLRCAHLGRLHAISLAEMCSCGRCLIQREVVNFFHSPRVADLRELVISGDRLDASHLIAMLKKTTLTNLKRLDLSHNPLGAAGVAQVVHCAALQGLEELDLSGTGPTRTGFDFLAKAHFPKLKRLALRKAGVGKAALKLLMKSDLMNRLSELDLRDNNIGDSGGSTVLMEQAGFDNLDVLDLRGNDIGDTVLMKHRFGRGVRV